MSSTKARRSKAVALAGLVVVAAAAVAFLLVQNRDSARPVASAEKKRFWITKLPPAAGSPQARTTVEFFVEHRSPCNCSYELSLLGRALGELEPKRLHVVFWGGDGPDGRERLRKLRALGTQLGIAINGRSKFRVIDAHGTSAGATKDINLLLRQHLWTLPDFYYALSEELKKAPGGKGLSMSASEFESRLSARMVKLRLTIPSDGSDLTR